jgi:cell division protein FtsN
MSIFGKIASAIFGITPAHADEVPKSQQVSVAAGAIPVAPATPAAVAAAAPSVTTAAPAAAKPTVDVAKVLDGISDEQDEDLDWRRSIVDLMKLLKLDSSLKSRKELATELKYSGDMGDSASMNIWLHKQVMTKLAENGGVVPAALKH